MTAADTHERLRQALAPHLGEGKAPGLVALTARGEAAQATAMGARGHGAAAPMPPDAIFRIASMTKPMTAVAALMLVEDGALALDEPVDRLLPELADRRVLRSLNGPVSDTVPARRPITVEDLLTFRMGLGIVFGSPDAFPILAAVAERDLEGFGAPHPVSHYGPDAWIARLGELPLMAQPGERWLYTTPSNVLGVLIARAAGEPFADVMRRRIFAPLGMADTGFFAPADKRGRLADAYWTTPAGPLANADDYTRPPTFAAGDAGLVSTAADVFAFSRFLLRGGRTAAGTRLLSEAAVAAMTRDHLTPAQRADAAPILPPGHGWGYSLAVTLERTPEGVPAGAFGWNGGLGTSWIMDPSGDATAILLTQAAFTSPDPPAVHKAFWRAVFDA